MFSRTLSRKIVRQSNITSTTNVPLMRTTKRKISTKIQSAPSHNHHHRISTATTPVPTRGIPFQTRIQPFSTLETPNTTTKPSKPPTRTKQQLSSHASKSNQQPVEGEKVVHIDQIPHQIGQGMTREQLNALKLPSSDSQWSEINKISRTDIGVTGLGLTMVSLCFIGVGRYLWNNILSTNHLDNYKNRINKTKNELVKMYHNDSEGLLLQPFTLNQILTRDEIEPQLRNGALRDFQNQLEGFLYKDERSSYVDLVQTLDEFRKTYKLLRSLTLKLQVNKFIMAPPPQSLSNEVSTNRTNGATTTQNHTQTTHPDQSGQSTTTPNPSLDLSYELQDILDNHLVTMAQLQTHSKTVAMSISSFQQAILQIATTQVNLQQDYPIEANNYYISELTIPMLQSHTDLRHLSLKLLHQQYSLGQTLLRYDELLNKLINQSAYISEKRQYMDINMQIHALQLKPEEYKQYIHGFKNIIHNNYDDYDHDDLNNNNNNNNDTNNDNLNNNNENFNRLFGLNSFENILDFNTTIQQLDNVLSSIFITILPQLDQFIPQMEFDYADGDNDNDNDNDNDGQGEQQQRGNGTQLEQQPPQQQQPPHQQEQQAPEPQENQPVEQNNKQQQKQQLYVLIESLPEQNDKYSSELTQLPIIEAISYGRGLFVPVDDDFDSRQNALNLFKQR